MPPRSYRGIAAQAGPQALRERTVLGGEFASDGVVVFGGMTQDQVRRSLSAARAELGDLGVRSLDLFGSVARGEARADSDVDLLVEFDHPIGLFHFFHVQQRLEAILGARVDLVMRDAVKPQLRERILAEAVRAA